MEPLNVVTKHGDTLHDSEEDNNNDLTVKTDAEDRREKTGSTCQEFSSFMLHGENKNKRSRRNNLTFCEIFSEK